MGVIDQTDPSGGNPPEGPTVKLHAEIVAKINFAYHQSAFPVLTDLSIENLDEEARVEGLLIELTSNPGFIKPKVWRVDRLAEGGRVRVQGRDLELDADFLLNLSEAVRGTVTITVKKDENIIDEYIHEIEILAFNEWGGVGYMPELLAAFSTPNDPNVDRILKQAAEVLRNAGDDPAIDGYRARSRSRVWKLASAIYSAIAHLGLDYALPPTSFERDGQRIRLPADIVSGGVATCLDTSMLFASCLEQAGLNPIIVVPEGHALVGVWLQPEELSTIVIDEAETLRKREQLLELILIETTTLTSHPPVPFSRSLQKAKEIMAPEKDDTFSAAIDIKRARSHRITPLATKVERPTGEDGIGGTTVILPIEDPPPLPDFDIESEEDLPDTPQTRLERWQRKLLELTARNPLLSHKSSKTSLKIICPDPGELEDKLSDGGRISIEAMSAPTSKAQDEEIHRERTGESISEEYAKSALQKNQVLVDLPKDELQKRSVEIYRKAQTSLQEGGSNTLYLALGFLLWKRDDKKDKADRRHRAPLILVPVNMERKSVRSGVKLTYHDDESKFNTTLLEMLRKDFEINITGLDGELPKDESGVDVAGVWNKIRLAIKDAPGFEVVEEVVLGHFSFAKYLMWKDLVDRTDALKNNPIVKHLIETPRETYESEVAFVERDQIDKLFKPSDLLAPLPADASQMAAIGTADRGKDFIIIGPPGTGKSQTISNLITHLLGKGKTVLFVSEKIAALNVVHRRLAEIGIGRFCLQLHSNKARKREILDQLNRAWTQASTQSSQSWELDAQRLEMLRDQLNKVVEHLHMRRRNGMTAHEGMGVKIRDEEFTNRVKLYWPSSEHHTEEMLRTMKGTVEKLAVQAGAVGNFNNSPFQTIETGEWSPQWERDITEKAFALSKAVDDCERAYQGLIRIMGVEFPNRSMETLENLLLLGEGIAECYGKQVAFALEPEAEESFSAIEEAVGCLQRYAKSQAELSCSYDPFTWRQLDPASLLRRWTEANQSWFLKAFFVKRSIVKELKEGGAKAKPDPERDIAVLIKLKEEGEAIEALDGQLSSMNQWRKHDTEPNAISDLRSLGIKVKQAVGQVSTDVGLLMELRGKVRALVYDGNDLLSPEAPAGRAVAAFKEQMDSLGQAADAFSSLAGKSIRDHFAETEDIFGVIRETADRIAEQHEELNNWCSWRRRRNEAVDQELLPLVEAIEGGQVPVDEISDTFEAAYCTWWSGQLITEDKVLREFNTAEHTATINKFREADDKFRTATAAHVVAKLSGQIPNQNNKNVGKQWGVLKREIQKRGKHIPVRKLVAESPEVIAGLAPCLMMSPLSVAQYLPADQELFDVVIFDEASQITVWDAVGAIARGKQTIIAGDPKQMPPSNFFARSDDDPDGDINQEGDLESILDEMRGSSIPELTLNLHYRSRRESLIAFSNSRYYEDALITFPAPVTPDKGVSLIRPDGFYSRGKARHNQGEAKAIAAEIVRRLTHKDEAVRKQSIGVVTFNTEQQSLIMDLLDEERRKNSGIEGAFNTEEIEPVFVKNLETVQGDERDVILFSVTYGPDHTGHVTMNFGPLNKQGGERRLNVAMTRARSEMIVFSTLRPEDIDLSRSSAEAVKDLKHFLEYAERGPSALAAAVYGSVADFDSPFEIAVARELKRKGWTVHQQIGVSSYRIDLGIVHPDHPGVYLAGVECDGAMYHSTAYARERDKIRQAKLEDLGWTIVRVWSTDWWINKSAAFATLDQFLTAHLEEDRRQRKETEKAGANDARGGQDKVVLGFDGTNEGAPEDQKVEINNIFDLPVEDYTVIKVGADTVVAGVFERKNEEENTVNPDPAVTENPNLASCSECGYDLMPTLKRCPKCGQKQSVLIEAKDTVVAGVFESASAGTILDNHSRDREKNVETELGALSVNPTGSSPHDYVYTAFDEPALQAKPDQFYNEHYECTLCKMIKHVVDTEGPIHEDILARRIARHHGWKKAGKKIKLHIYSVFQNGRGSTDEKTVGQFYWQKGTKQDEQHTQVRYNNRNDEMKNVTYICKEELGAIDRELGLNKDVRELAKKIGISRLTEKTKERLDRCLGIRWRHSYRRT
jgi:very-short-patch-repair endonuclease